MKYFKNMKKQNQVKKVAIRQESRIKLGTFLAEVSRKVGGFNIDTERDKTLSDPVSFE
jgi:hypothetical protein